MFQLAAFRAWVQVWVQIWALLVPPAFWGSTFSLRGGTCRALVAHSCGPVQYDTDAFFFGTSR